MSYTNGLDKPTDYFNTKLYSGDGTSSNAITGVGFKPDWLWIKNRTDSGISHVITDSVTFSDRRKSNSNSADETNNRVGSYDSDGFTLNSSSSQVNASSKNYVAWSWRASNTTAVSNTDGSITSSVSASTTAGFSIVSYTGNGTSGATVGHGLGVTPSVVWVKNRSNVDPWTCFYSTLGNGKYIELDATSPAQTPGVAGRWNNTDPNSTVITFGNDDDVNGNTENYVAYFFAEKKGYSKFGSYTGNGNADGTFIYTGFKPSFVLVKQTNASGEDWFICDNKREGYNGENNRLLPNANSSESTDSPIDILSNGFKARQSGAAVNGSGSNYIYMTFAESPFVTSTGIPTTAR